MRAVFFTAQDAGYTVTLLTSDQQSEDSAACKTFTGSGATCAAAWNAAAQTMNGQPFYGLMDLAVLPAGCSWPLAEEIAQLLQSTARPAPEIAVFVLDPAVQMPIQDQTPTLYENLKALEEKQQLHCGLQTLFDNAETAAVPVSAGGEYAMLFYDTAANTARQTQSPLAAQLAAILCGQAHRLDCTLPDDLHLAAKAARRCAGTGPRQRAGKPDPAGCGTERPDSRHPPGCRTAGGICRQPPTGNLTV